MKLDPDHELSPQTIAALRELLQEPEPPEEDLRDESLIKFLLGDVSEEERRATVKALVKSSRLRSDLARIHRELEKTSLLSASRPTDSALARSLNRGLIHALGVDPSFERREERPVASAMSCTLKAIGQSLNALFAMPRYATLRRGAASSSLEPSENVETSTFVELSEDGTLTVDASFTALEGATINGRRIRLYLLDPAGGSICIGTSHIDRSRAHFLVEGFGAVTDLEPASLPSEHFQIVFEDQEVQTPGSYVLFAETEAERAPLTMPSAPVLSNGFLSLTLSVPKAIIDRFAGQWLEIRAMVGSVDLPLHSCPLSSFEEGEKTIRVLIDGFNGSRTVCGSLLRARILKFNPQEDS